MFELIEGSIVHYVLNEGKNAGEHRPAIVVKVWRTSDGKVPENGCSQLQVFLDKGNDGPLAIVCKTSVTFDESGAPGSWHPIEMHAYKEEETSASVSEDPAVEVREDPGNLPPQ